MIRYLNLLALLFGYISTMAPLAAAQAIISNVASPTAAGTYAAGSTLHISWKAVSAYSDIRIVIDLSLDNGKTWVLITPDGSIPNSAQQYSWSIPDSLAIYDPVVQQKRMFSTVTSSAKIMLYEYDGATERFLAGPFSITGAPQNSIVKRSGTSLPGLTRTDLIADPVRVLPGSGQSFGLSGRLLRGVESSLAPGTTVRHHRIGGR